MIYLWSGSKSTKKKYKKGYNKLKDLTSNFPELNLQYTLVKKNFPSDIHNKLESMLESTRKEERSTLIFSRFTTIRAFFIFLIGIIILPTISLLNLSSSLTWKTSNGNLEVNGSFFQLWVKISQNLILVTIIIFIINLIVGIIEVENQVIIFSIIGLVVCVGIYLYLDFGIYLFPFQEGSTLDNYIILRSDIFAFMSINVLLVLFFESLNIYKLISFLKTYSNFIF